MSVSVSERDNVSGNVSGKDNVSVSVSRICNTDNMSVSVSGNILRKDNVSVSEICNVSGETDVPVVMADTVEHDQGGVQDRGD